MPSDSNVANGSTMSVLLDRTLLVLSAATTAILFAWRLYYRSYGLDLKDEGFWLNFIANPFAHTINIPPTLFGFIYHWPYQWVGGDIAVLRAANVTLALALGWILSFLVIRRLWTMDWPHAAALSAGMGSVALAAFQNCMLLTPNYYTLNIQSFLMVMIGLLLADRPGRMRQVSASVLVGVGVWCSFMARPTSAAALALVVMLYVVVLGRKSLLPLLGAALVALALLIATAYLIGDGIIGLVNRMIDSTEGIALLGGGHQLSRIFRIEGLPTSRLQLDIAVLMATGLLLSIFMGTAHKLLVSVILAAVLIVTIAIALLGADPISIKPSTLFLVPAFTCLGAISYRERVLSTQVPTSIALALTFLGLPHLLTLGSAAEYWWNSSLAALFWMLAVVAFLGPRAQQGRSVATLLPLTVFAQLLTASVVNADMLKPFRQVKDLRGYTAVVSLPGNVKLVLSQPFHDYLATARVQARAAGLEVGTPVVDLSDLPTLLYVLEARSLGLPWLFGGYPGSNAVAVRTLRLESCADLARAWLLIAPEGPRRLDQASVMASFGAQGADYVTAATFAAPVMDRYHYYPNSHRQFLFKPVRPAALAEQSCREARRQTAG
ncbi:hypothetical protein [Bradyrhizobium sp. 87]|uniref:hypothetical protein n=1 Tax=Bradyrhizobium sp. 87 TaxID=2782682 RepID=UPI001FF72C62|nr:hypothetical protein [Bradyrhizobium sp. 87]MCK1429189.1 hypothetical protein [Bradyrhizobium sp. 87]